MKSVWVWFLCLVLAEILSRVVVFHPTINGIIALFFGLSLLIITVFRPATGLAILTSEYLIGSMGSLFRLGADETNHGGQSIRIIFFAAFLFGWAIWSVRHKTWRGWQGLLETRKIYFLLALTILYGFLLGWWRGNQEFIFQDVNAWVLWLLLLPVLDVVSHEREEIKKYMFPAVLAALTWLFIKILIWLFLFTHQLVVFDGSFYLWLRRIGGGEITSLGQGAYRIFLQSQIYSAFAFLLALAWMSKQPRARLGVWFFAVLSCATLLTSLSRSFWLGTAAGFIFLLAFFIWRDRFSFFRLIKTTIVIKFAAILLVSTVVLAPLPPVSFTALQNMFLGRADKQESAVLSRWQLLPVLWKKIQAHPVLGSGFGATVTYSSHDPRIVQKFGGLYTTYAFEWGWLEHWIKYGLIGIPLMLFILLQLSLRIWRSGQPEWLKLGSVSSLAALGIIHIFSPYLNHPLGIFTLIIAEAGLIFTAQTSRGTSDESAMSSSVMT